MFLSSPFGSTGLTIPPPIKGPFPGSRPMRERTPPNFRYFSSVYFSVLICRRQPDRYRRADDARDY